MEDQRIPVTIVTGFLGSGKTTLLNNIIKKYPDKKFAIIENEFGEIGIDSGLIIDSDSSIFELSNGCICCSLNDDFYNVIARLLNGDYTFNHLLVETTGIADPTSIVKAFISSDSMQKQFRIDSVVCLADALNMEDMMDSEIEIRKQIALSDIILLNKIESIDVDRVNELSKKIANLNPMAAIYPISYANISAIEILSTYAYSGKGLEASIRSFRNVSYQNSANPVRESAAIKAQQPEIRHDIKSVGITIPGRFDLDKFNLWIDNFLFFNSNNVFRIKGILCFENMQRQQIFHAVRGVYMTEQGADWGNDARFCKLVFIGKKLDRDNLEACMYQLLATTMF